MDDKKLEQLIDMLVKERNELKGIKEDKEKNQFEKGLAFFIKVWNLMVEYSKYFDKLEEDFEIDYKHTRIFTTRREELKYNLRMEACYGWRICYGVAKDEDIEGIIRNNYSADPQMMLFFLNELMEQPLEFYEEKIYKQLTNAIVKYNKINNDFKGLINKAD